MQNACGTAEGPTGPSWGAVLWGSFLLAFIVLFMFKDFNLYTYDPRFGEYRLKETASIPVRLLFSFLVSGVLALLNTIVIYGVNAAIRARRRQMSKHVRAANHEVDVPHKP